MLCVLASRLQFADEVVANIAVVALVEEGVDVEVELESLVEDEVSKFGKIWMMRFVLPPVFLERFCP